MKITDCFDRVKTAVAAAQSTLSKRSIARAPKSTRRQINTFQVVMTLNNLLKHMDEDCQLEQKIQQARSVASSAAGSVVDGNPTFAGEQMRTCSLMVVEAESFYLLQNPVTVEIQSCTTELNLEEHASTANTPGDQEATSVDDSTPSAQPTADLEGECGVNSVHATEEGNQ